ncbi:chordin-like protein 2 [Willisornis vidua]|uniref:Chordin-like protein 2 n=1 Tax=Willisornis vidua TaxID=1566151 RepID=A0ABQ9DPI6_9PASS|nr:chordin-like protein 2 [Willisornis vidua]
MIAGEKGVQGIPLSYEFGSSMMKDCMLQDWKDQDEKQMLPQLWGEHGLNIPCGLKRTIFVSSQNTNIRCYRIQCPALQCANPIMDPQQCCPRCLGRPDLLRFGDLPRGVVFLFLNRDGLLLPGLQSTLALKVWDIPGISVLLTGSHTPALLLPHQRHSQDQCLGEMMGRKPPGATVSTVLSSSLEFIPRNFKPKGTGGTTVKIVLKEKHKKACVYNGKTYSHGEVWHPVFRLYGLLPCILCTCRDGIQDCQKITCPKEYPCDYPEKVDGKCCKICPEIRVKPTDEIVTTQCGKNPSRVLVYTFVPPRSENSKEILRTMAIEKELAEEVEIYNWKLIKGIFHLIQTKKISKQEFKQEAQNFRMITRTNEGLKTDFGAGGGHGGQVTNPGRGGPGMMARSPINLLGESSNSVLDKKSLTQDYERIHVSLELSTEHQKEFQPVWIFADVDKTCEKKSSTHWLHHQGGEVSWVLMLSHGGSLKSLEQRNLTADIQT